MAMTADEDGQPLNERLEEAKLSLQSTKLCQRRSPLNYCRSSKRIYIPSRLAQIGGKEISYFFLEVAFACDDWKMSMQQQVPEMINAVILPIVYSGTKVC